MTKIKLDDNNRFVFTANNIEEIIEKKNQGFALKRHMNPWFSNQVGVRKAGCVYGWTQHEVDEFTKCAIDIHYFSNNYCKIKTESGQIRQMKLRDYQYDILNTYTKNRFTINMSSRQTGKCLSKEEMICISKDNGLTHKIISIKELINMLNIDVNVDDILDYDGNILNKIWHNEIVNDIKVLTITGWSDLDELNITKKMSTYKLTFENGNSIVSADLHLLMKSDGWYSVNNLEVGDEVIVGNKLQKITSKTFNSEKIELYDLSTSTGDFLTISKDLYKVDLTQNEFYENAILSHNTITAAITLLHYCTFNKNKGCMIVANKGDTVIEIIDKIKNIYKLLPFFLKAGIINWNQKNIVFENGCRIKSQARSKEPAIGFSIDFLYMDEFAHIPSNTIRHYYRAAIPTVSSISGSKIVITSTPNGANLFKELVEGAQHPEGHPEKNMYNLIKILWWQVPDGSFDDGTLGTRMDPKLYIDKFNMKKYKVTIKEVTDLFDALGFKYKFDSETTDNGEKEFIKLLYVNKKCTVDIIRKLKIGTVGLINIFNITTWEENEIKLIGGQENFNQEYNIQFVAGSNRILSAQKSKDLNDRIKKYKSRNIEVLDKKLIFPYLDNLKVDPLFIERERDKYYWWASIDTSEGLGQDESVMNFFRLMVRSDDWLKKNKIRSLHEAFYLKQTFVYSYNKLDPNKELTELFYLLGFEYLNPDKLKVVLELNSAGTDFLNGLKWVFNGDNNFGNYVFVKYKHNLNDKKKKIGLKVSRSKNKSVKSYIDCIENDTIYVDEETTLSQMESFIKTETRAGNFTYKADSGHDDYTMTLVNLSTAVETIDYKNMCQSYFSDLNSTTQALINDAMNLSVNPDVNSFSAMSKNINKVKNNNGTGLNTRFVNRTSINRNGNRFTSNGKGRFVKR